MSQGRNRPYQPPEEQLRLFPEVSGNSVNGHGEAVRRHARHG